MLLIPEAFQVQLNWLYSTFTPSNITIENILTTKDRTSLVNIFLDFLICPHQGNLSSSNYSLSQFMWSNFLSQIVSVNHLNRGDGNLFKVAEDCQFEQSPWFESSQGQICPALDHLHVMLNYFFACKCDNSTKSFITSS